MTQLFFKREHSFYSVIMTGALSIGIREQDWPTCILLGLLLLVGMMISDKLEKTL